MKPRKTIHRSHICDEGIALDEPAAAIVASASPRSHHDWTSRQRMRMLGRELRRPAPSAFASASTTLPGQNRFDPPANFSDGIEQVASASHVTVLPHMNPPALGRTSRAETSQIFSWLVVVVGSLSLVAGIGLIVWSLATQQMTHWNVALGLTLGGQGTLILGLVLVVSRLWRSSRHAVNKLQEAHARLSELQQTTDALAGMKSASAPAFYADLARGASPQVLLANLKGQLDQLATRLSSGW